MEHLAQSTGFRHLRHLSLAASDITGRGVCDLADSPAMSSLRELDLSGNIDTGDGGTIALAGSRLIKCLVGPRLSGFNVSEAGLKTRRRSPNMGRGDTFWFSGSDLMLVETSLGPC